MTNIQKNKIRMFDLHCDTILEVYKTKQSLISNNLQISLDKAALSYSEYTQLLAVFSDPSMTDDEAYSQFFNVIEYMKKDMPYSDFFNYYIAIEGANLLANDITRLDVLKKAGVRFLTLVWGGLTCIGGAHNEGSGFTPFGTEVAERCFEIGIVPDVSHSSDKLFWETAEIADRFNKPFVATHSNSRAICNHKRCLTDDMFKKIIAVRGLTGISLVRGHLSEDSSVCNLDTIASHIDHYLSLGGEDTVCLGCDWDGTYPLPDGINDVSDMYKLAETLLKINYSDELIIKIFYDNAKNFVLRNGIKL